MATGEWLEYCGWWGRRSLRACIPCSQAERRWRLPLYGVLRGDGGGMDPVRAWRRNRLPPKVRAICSPKIPSSLFKYSIRAPHPTLDSVTMSRQAWKGAAAAAARNLLKLDAARVNKAAAARKDAARLRICRRPEQRS
jgi:hypothetical protein